MVIETSMAQAQPNQTANQTFLPLGEALMYAERCRTEGKLMEAEAVCRQILQAQPNVAEAEHLLGVIAHQNGKLGEAIEHVKRAAKLAPQVALFHANLGEMLRLAGRPKLAADAARAALEIEPTMPAALSNLGVALYELKDYEGAARAQRKAIAAKPDFAEAHSNLGNALHALRRFDEAIPAYRRAIEINPNYADGWANLGTTLHHSGSFEEGISALRRAIALAPHHANARSGLGILLLMRGDLAEGWDEYEWRLRSTERKGPKFPEIPWQGESLAGKHIYVQAEQGFGDTLQFARYMPLLLARGAKVTLRVHQQLVSLMRESLPGVVVLGDRGDPGAYQCDAVLLSLPRLFKTRLETIPAQVPYLHPPADAAARWNSRLAKMKGLRIGIVWAGNPDHVNDSRRSLDLSMFAPLFAVRGTTFASLQYGPRAADLKKLKRKTPIEDLAASFEDFIDTAAAINALDLVITVDTSVAHVAGALGKPVWVLLPWVTDWRWLLNREDNPWYPTMRLFRQKKGEDQAAVIARMEQELKAVVQGEAERLTPFKAEGERRAAEAAAIIAAEAIQAAKPVAAPAQAATPGQALILAEQKRRHGFLADADDLTRRAAAADPDNAEAAHMLGIIAHQSGKTAEAIDHIRRAIAIKPDVALYHANLGEMCRLAGRVDEAIAAGRRAIEINPNYAGALSNLGIALFDQGKFERRSVFTSALSHWRATSPRPTATAATRCNGSSVSPTRRRTIAAPSNYSRASPTPGTISAPVCASSSDPRKRRPSIARRSSSRRTIPTRSTIWRWRSKTSSASTKPPISCAARLPSNRATKSCSCISPRYCSISTSSTKRQRQTSARWRSMPTTMTPSIWPAASPSNAATSPLRWRITGARSRSSPIWPTPITTWATCSKSSVSCKRPRMPICKRSGSIRTSPASMSISPIPRNSCPAIRIWPTMEALAAKTDGLSKTDRLQLDFALGKAYGDLKDYRALIHASARRQRRQARHDLL